jgi:hypothetical protein
MATRHQKKGKRAVSVSAVPKKKPKPRPLEQAPRPTADWAKSNKLLGFVMRLGQHGNVTRALKAAKLDRGYAYDKRATDQEFAQAWDDAKKMGLDVLKDEAWRRAHEGVLRDKYHAGDVCGQERVYSDTLLMFLIKQADPSYREHFDVNLGNAGGRPFMFQMVLNPEAAKLAQAQAGRK